MSRNFTIITFPTSLHETSAPTNWKIRITGGRTGVHCLEHDVLSQGKYPVHDRTVGRSQGTGGTTLSRIQKSKNVGSWCSKHFTTQKTIVWLRTGVLQKVNLFWSESDQYQVSYESYDFHRSVSIFSSPGTWRQVAVNFRQDWQNN